ncbi:MAG: hypothetical protein AAF393_01250 [Pseudomonadota bacterium]
MGDDGELSASAEATRKALDRLGWLSTYTRQFVISRHMLRCIDVLDEVSDLQREELLLTYLRAAIFGISGASRDVKGVFSAPYEPHDHPERHFISFYRGSRIFSLGKGTLTNPSGPDLHYDHSVQHFEDEGLRSHFFYDESVEKTHQAVFLEEFEEIRRGVRLSAKEIGDQNCDEIFYSPLWRGRSSPNAEHENLIEVFNKEDASTWSFWKAWFDGFISGEPIERNLQRKVASIKAKIWEEGAEAVAEEIERIKAEFLAEKAPLAEDIVFNEESSKFLAVPREIAKPDLLGATLSQVEDALEDCLADAGNGLTERSRETRVLNRTLTRYANDPQRVEMDLTSVAIGLRRQFEETEELPKTEENLALQKAVEEGAIAIRATHPEVAENREIIANQALQELPEADREALDQAQEVFQVITEGAMAEDFAEDIPALINDTLLPLPDGAPKLPGADPATRVFSRTSKIAQLLQKYPEFVEKIEKNPVYKTLGIVGRGLKVIGWISIVVGIGLSVFGVL